MVGGGGKLQDHIVASSFSMRVLPHQYLDSAQVLVIDQREMLTNTSTDVGQISPLRIS